MATAHIKTMTIASGNSTSTESLSDKELRHASAIAIQAPDTLPETVDVEVTLDGTNWSDYAIQGTALSVDAGLAEVISPVPFIGLRLRALVNVAADRVFIVAGEY